MVSRESFLLFNNMLLLVTTALILIGTQIGKLLGVPLVSDQFFLRIAEGVRRHWRSACR